MDTTTNTTPSTPAGNTLSSINPVQPEPRVVNIGDVIRLVVRPWGYIEEFRADHGVRSEDVIYEVTVTAKKTAEINFV